jgi:polysaccharide deacetylase family protein (PEP-CTERM system associated)
MLNALTIDLEDYFHVANFSGMVPYHRWDSMPLRLEESTECVLQLLDRHQLKATFFILGWVAERMKGLVRMIAAQGHEVACHSYRHELAYDLDAATFRADIRKAKAVIEDVVGCRVVGYRAPSYSIVKKNLGYLKILAEEDFLYDSSIFPVYHDRYGIPDWERFPGPVAEEGWSIIEYPPSTFRLFGQNFPMAGGGYLRLFPIKALSYCISRINAGENQPAVIYFHPWEFDCHQPRIQTSKMRQFRHYLNIPKVSGKIDYLFSRHRFGPIRELLEPNGTATMNQEKDGLRCKS